MSFPSLSTGPTITVTDITPRHLRPGSEGDSYSLASSPPRRRASDRAAASSDNGSAKVLGMTRDELFDAFSRFLNTRDVESRAAVPASDVAQDGNEDSELDEPEGLVVADRPQPAKAHAKAKTKQRR